jgi:hypothetical protein
MSPTTILALQSLLQFLQIVNAGLATIPHIPVAIPLMSAAALGGLSYFVQHVGNQSTPPPKQ